MHTLPPAAPPAGPALFPQLSRLTSTCTLLLLRGRCMCATTHALHADGMRRAPAISRCHADLVRLLPLPRWLPALGLVGPLAARTRALHPTARAAAHEWLRHVPRACDRMGATAGSLTHARMDRRGVCRPAPACAAALNWCFSPRRRATAARPR
jgi:hypothetical protein